jgi:2-polyprenyl-3-methyl-5-hydroxy-6-metoxy-1,4-benzoquinol methylase
MNCRGCGAELSLTFLDLGVSPIANNLIEFQNLSEEDIKYPLHVMTCQVCTLVQLSEVIPRESLFPSNYTYFSSYSSSWLNHSKTYAEKMISFLELNQNDLVVEVASNDGYLLQFFANSQIQVLGIEPASGVAKAAIAKGIPTQIEYFGESAALELSKGKKPKLMIGNNVLAHVPDLHDFIQGFSVLIHDDGLITFEFPHLLNLIKNSQFDTVYHEHYSYLNITPLIALFAQHGLKIVDVENLSTHGGSLRIYVAKYSSKWAVHESVQNIIEEESKWDPSDKYIYSLIQNKTKEIKANLHSALIKYKKEGKKISAYGAAAKGVTLLNYCNISTDLIDYVVDLNPKKQGRFMPGSRIPIVDLKMLDTNPPDILLILAWNLTSEIKFQLSNYLKAGMKAIRAIPNLEYV